MAVMGKAKETLALTEGGEKGARAEGAGVSYMYSEDTLSACWTSLLQALADFLPDPGATRAPITPSPLPVPQFFICPMSRYMTVDY